MTWESLTGKFRSRVSWTNQIVFAIVRRCVDEKIYEREGRVHRCFSAFDSLTAIGVVENRIGLVLAGAESSRAGYSRCRAEKVLARCVVQPVDIGHTWIVLIVDSIRQRD